LGNYNLLINKNQEKAHKICTDLIIKKMNSPRNKQAVIAIDGHSSCGKSTLAKDIAKELRYTYIDTGAMYRCVTLFVLSNEMIEDGVIDENKLEKEMTNINITFRLDAEKQKYYTLMNGEEVEEEIRGMDVSNFVSPVSKIKFVRQRLVELQREMGKKGGIVMDGRDIGTVVFPDADVKIFLTADIRTRSQRRYLELKEKGIDISIQEVQKNISERDHIDSTRKESPLRQAKDAVLLDNSHLSREEQKESALMIIREKLKISTQEGIKR